MCNYRNQHKDHEMIIRNDAPAPIDTLTAIPMVYSGIEGRTRKELGHKKRILNRANRDSNKSKFSMERRQLRKQQFYRRVRFSGESNTISSSSTTSDEAIRRPQQQQSQEQASPTATTWYGLEDYNSFKMDTARTISALAGTNYDISCLNPNEHVVRGLEAIVTRERMYLGKLRISLTVGAVLDQQEIQRSRGVHNPQLLSIASSFYSRRAKKIAQTTGYIDSIVV